MLRKQQSWLKNGNLCYVAIKQLTKLSQDEKMYPINLSLCLDNFIANGLKQSIGFSCSILQKDELKKE